MPTQVNTPPHQPAPERGNFWPHAAARWSGVGVTAAVLLAVELANRGGVRLPNPPAFFVMAVVLAAFRGGIAPGVVSAVMSVAYGAYFFDSTPGPRFGYTPDDGRRVLIWGVVTPLIAVLVGALKSRERRAARREAEAHIGRSALAAKVDSLKAARDALEESERRIRETEARYRALFEQCPDGVMVVDPDGGKILEANAALTRLSGYARDDLVSLRVSDLEGRESPEETMAHLRKTAAAGSDEFETRLKTRDGSYREVAVVVKAVLISGRPLLHTIVRDIGERKRADAQVRESAERRQAMLDSALDCVITMDESGRIVEFNPAAERTFGYRRPDILGRLVSETIVPPAARGAHHDGLQNYLRTGTGRVIGRRTEMVAMRAGGEEFPVELAIVPSRLQDGTLLFTAYLRDITLPKRAERALVDAERRYRSLVENSPMGIIVHQDGRVVYANDAAVKLLRAPARDDLIGREVMSMVHPDYKATVRARIQHAMKTGGPAPLLEEKLIRFDGSVVDVEVVGAATVFAGKPALQVIVNDISERKRLLSELFQSQKMEAVGHLAAGITHDFNNLLTGIFSYIGLARQSLRPDDPAAQALDGVASAAAQAAGVTRSLLTFSRRLTPEMTLVDLRQVVEETVRLIRPSMPSSINVVGPPGAALERPVWVRADPVQLKQAVVNLALNSRDAMPAGGVLTIGLSAEDAWARLSVADTGTGVPPEVRARIFDPFFTTKESGENTGLGLSVVDAIAKAHGGRIDVDSSPGKGALFTIVLPGCVFGTDGVRAEAGPTRDDGVLIVCADNRQVRAVIATTLRRAGYVVMEAGDPVAMGQVADRYREEIRLCVVDAIGPDSPSVAALAVLRTRTPGVCVVVLCDSQECAAAHVAPGVHVVVKPFQVAQLVELADRLLHPAPTETTMAGQLEDPER